ncbi:MAG: class I SAM-dependent methyltransferase [Opitutales bacterium]|nr:class I SAM-dependent methyltransferase [Opitutales bacterium]
MQSNYDSISEAWIKNRREISPNDLELFELFISHLPDFPHILDLGCGSGNPVAKFLVKRGAEITGVDRSKELLDYAVDILPNHKWVLSDLFDYEPDSLFDGVVIWDSMFHFPREKHKKLLQKAYNALKPSGLLILSSGGSEENVPAFTDTMFGQTFYYDSYPVFELLELCQVVGFNVLETKLVNKPDGERDKGRLGLVLKK